MVPLKVMDVEAVFMTVTSVLWALLSISLLRSEVSSFLFISFVKFLQHVIHQVQVELYYLKTNMHCKHS